MNPSLSSALSLLVNASRVSPTLREAVAVVETVVELAARLTDAELPEDDWQDALVALTDAIWEDS
jgi:hypothetical protein